MGLFSWLFGGPPSIEKRLEQEYVPMLRAMMNLSAEEAQKDFQEMLTRVKQAAQAELKPAAAGFVFHAPMIPAPLARKNLFPHTN